MAAPSTSDAVDEADEAPDGVDAERRSGRVEPGQQDERLDRWLASRNPEFSRVYLQGLIAGGQVVIDGQRATSASRRVRLGQQIEVSLVPTAESRAFRPEPMALAIVFEDEHLTVIDKPAGLVVHPAPGNWSGTLLNGLLAHHPGAAALPRAGIVHRLDKDTSGLMVVARTAVAMTALTRAIAAREVQREYLAVAHGVPRSRAWSIEAPVGRDPAVRVRMAVVPGGKPARTDVSVVAAGAALCALRCRLHTGRTHQIRVHLAHAGHPLVSDALYGGRPALGLARQALHAHRLVFDHPLGSQRIDLEVAAPPDLAAAWQQVLAAACGSDTIAAQG